MNRAIDPEAFRRLLRERCLSGELLRKRLGISPTTLARLYRGDPVSDYVFRRVVSELDKHPVIPLARELMPREEAGAAEAVAR